MKTRRARAFFTLHTNRGDLKKSAFDLVNVVDKKTGQYVTSRYVHALEEGTKIEDHGRIYEIDSLERLPMAASRKQSGMGPFLDKGQFSMNPGDSAIEVDQGAEIGNENEFPLDATGEAQKEIIRQVNQNRNDITSLAASELVKIAREMMA